MKCSQIRIHILFFIALYFCFFTNNAFSDSGSNDSSRNQHAERVKININPPNSLERGFSIGAKSVNFETSFVEFQDIMQPSQNPFTVDENNDGHLELVLLNRKEGWIALFDEATKTLQKFIFLKYPETQTFPGTINPPYLDFLEEYGGKIQIGDVLSNLGNTYDSQVPFTRAAHNFFGGKNLDYNCLNRYIYRYSEGACFFFREIKENRSEHGSELIQGTLHRLGLTSLVISLPSDLDLENPNQDRKLEQVHLLRSLPEGERRNYDAFQLSSLDVQYKFGQISKTEVYGSEVYGLNFEEIQNLLYYYAFINSHSSLSVKKGRFQFLGHTDPSLNDPLRVEMAKPPFSDDNTYTHYEYVIDYDFTSFVYNLRFVFNLDLSRFNLYGLGIDNSELENFIHRRERATENTIDTIDSYLNDFESNYENYTLNDIKISHFYGGSLIDFPKPYAGNDGKIKPSEVIQDLEPENQESLNQFVVALYNSLEKKEESFDCLEQELCLITYDGYQTEIELPYASFVLKKNVLYEFNLGRISQVSRIKDFYKQQRQQELLPTLDIQYKKGQIPTDDIQSIQLGMDKNLISWNSTNDSVVYFYDGSEFDLFNSFNEYIRINCSLLTQIPLYSRSLNRQDGIVIYARNFNINNIITSCWGAINIDIISASNSLMISHIVFLPPYKGAIRFPRRYAGDDEKIKIGETIQSNTNPETILRDLCHFFDGVHSSTSCRILNLPDGGHIYQLAFMEILISAENKISRIQLNLDHPQQQEGVRPSIQQQ